jgi:hypothetical protein
VQFKKGVLQREIDEMHKRCQVEVKKIAELFQILSVPADLDPLETANAYQESGLVNFSHPNFISKVNPSHPTLCFILMFL